MNGSEYPIDHIRTQYACGRDGYLCRTVVQRPENPLPSNLTTRRLNVLMVYARTFDSRCFASGE